MIHEHFGDGSRWGVSIHYIHEDKPLGTAGSLGLLPTDLLDLPIIMMNGDILTRVDFEALLEFHNHNKGIATMCVREYDFQVPYGVVKSKDCRITNIVEKPIHSFFVNAGIYVLSLELIKTINGDSYLDMPHLLDENIENGKVINMFPIHEYWLDIGQKDQYILANQEIASI
jgi:NDP-sugar pyrophosphorylase family protein